MFVNLEKVYSMETTENLKALKETIKNFLLWENIFI